MKRSLPKNIYRISISIGYAVSEIQTQRQSNTKIKNYCFWLYYIYKCFRQWISSMYRLHSDKLQFLIICINNIITYVFLYSSGLSFQMSDKSIVDEFSLLRIRVNHFRVGILLEDTVLRTCPWIIMLFQLNNSFKPLW